MKKLWLCLAAIAVCLSLVAVPVSAQATDEDIPTFDKFLEALSGPLVGGAVAIILSIVVEYVPKYEGLAPRWKRLVFVGLCFIVPIGAAALRGFLGFVTWSFDPLFWHAIWYGFAAAGIGTLAHARKLKAG